MRFSVTKLAPALVAPCEATPSGNLLLSSIDRTAAVKVLVDLILVFEHGREPANVIREALSKALVPYYPVAGRIIDSDQGEPEAACTGDGVWFVEASASCSLKDVNNLERPLMIPKEELLPRAPQVNQEEMILMMQVTQFTCGGFAVGVTFSHVIFDGLGVSQFLNTVAEIARGLPSLSIEPVWCREAIPSPPKKLPRGDPPTFTAFRFESSIVDISAESINRIKNQFMRESGHKCSTFDVVTAMIWQCRTRAINLEPHADVRLGFAANIRHLLQQALPGYYGNCVYPMGITAASGKVAHATIFDVVGLIRDGKERLATNFSEWLVGDPKEDPYAVPLDYGTLCVSDWTRVGFAELDYGWGEPIHVLPLNDDSNFIASAIYLKPPKPKQGVRLMARCVEEEHLAAFNDEMMKLA